jgi:hypothetical protein
MCSGFVTPHNIQWQIRTRYDSSGRVIGPSQKPLPDTKYSQKIYVHAAGRIRTCNCRKRAAANPLRGRRDRLQRLPNTYIYVRLCTNLNSIDFRDSSVQLNINNYNQVNKCAAVPQFRQQVNGASNDGGLTLVSKCSFGGVCRKKRHSNSLFLPVRVPPVLQNLFIIQSRHNLTTACRSTDRNSQLN